MGFPDGEVQGAAGRRYRWTDLSVLILSLLLAASVATVIFMAVQPPADTCIKANTSSGKPQTDHQSRNFDLDVEVDGEEVPEKVAYNEDSNVAKFYDERGNFAAEDFDKGWVVSKIDGSNECVVIPTGNSLNRSTVSSVMSKLSQSHRVQGMYEPNGVHAQILPGYIEDKSMFDDEVNKICSGGYKWLTTVDLGSDDSFQVGARKKRRAENCFCSIRVSLPIYMDSLFNFVIRSYWACLDWTCFDSDCTLWSSCELDLNHPLARLFGYSNTTTVANSTTTAALSTDTEAPATSTTKPSAKSDFI